MEGNKLELSAKPDSAPASAPPATYKLIPETDMEEEAVRCPKNLAKAKNHPEIDGAEEKMLPNEDKIIANACIAKISSNEKQNGDAKLDIGDLKSAFVGLTKEELMKYANDPFWVRLRWFLFVTFWLLWAAMLVGAIMIIYAAPKCDPPPPRTWWQQGPLSEVKSDIKLDQLKSLKDKNVKGVIINWLEDSYTKINDTNIMEILNYAKIENINIIIGLEPGTSQLWFNSSENKNAIFDDYYIWKAPSRMNGSGAPEPPNNWLTIKNVSSWTFSPKRKEFYYSPTGKPHLNFRNPNVTNEFSNVIKQFLNNGAKGIKLKGVPYLFVDSKFEDEPVKTNAPGFIHTDYGFYIHSKTENLIDLGALLKIWRDIIKDQTGNGPFMIEEEISNIEVYKINNSLVIDLPMQSHLFSNSNINISEIVKSLNSTFNINNITWPLWRYNEGDVWDIVTYLLPGVPLVGSNSTINGELLKIRSTPSIMRGTFSFYEISNRTGFAYIRVTPGNPGILVAFNPSSDRIVVDFPEEIEAVSDEVTVQLLSNNYNETDVTINVKQNSHYIPISPKSAIVLSYVPKIAKK